MGKKFILLSFIFIFILTGCTILSATKETNNKALESETKEFAFIFKYGVGAKNVLDTYKNEFTKDMISEEPITVKMTLKENQLKAIRNKMREIDIYNYPKFKQNFTRTPYLSYYLEVQEGDQVVNLNWNDSSGSDNPKIINLLELSELIIETIQSSPEYKKLPEPKGGYQ